MKVSEDMVERALHVYANSGPTKDVRMRAALEAALSALPPDGEAVAWQWSDFSGKWYTPDTARMTSTEQEELARSIAESRHGRVRPLYTSPANADRSEGVTEIEPGVFECNSCNRLISPPQTEEGDKRVVELLEAVDNELAEHGYADAWGLRATVRATILALRNKP